MWNETGWGPMMYGGWWFMPLFGIIFMLICFFLFSRFFSAGGNMCQRKDQQGNMHDIIAELRREIHDLRMEIHELRSQIKTNNKKMEGL